MDSRQEQYWNLMQVMAWVDHRDRELVRKAADESLAPIDLAEQARSALESAVGIVALADPNESVVRSTPFRHLLDNLPRRILDQLVS